MGDLRRAISDYEQALRLNPKMDTAAQNLEVVRMELARRRGR